MEQNLFEKLCRAAGQVRQQEPMSRHTTFRIGGPADYFAVPDTLEALQNTVNFCRKYEIPYYIIGNGSNLLVGDQGIRGVVIQIYRNLNAVTVEGCELKAQAGAMLSVLAKRAMEQELSGLEFAAGIPGTLGGAVVMNAGAYGGEMKDVLVEITVLTPQGSILVIPAEQMEFGYRTSIVEKNHDIVLEAKLRLSPGHGEEIRSRMEELREKRVTKQPLDLPSAGSTFKRPEGHFAGKLIMDAGLEGFSVGDAQVSKKHCGFVVNRGKATAAQVVELMHQVSDRVEQKSGVRLEPEVKMVGEFISRQ